MRIGYMYNLEAYPPRGGNHVHALEIAQGLVDAGHNVSVLDDPTMPRVANFLSAQPGGIESFVDACDVLYIRVDARFMGRWPQAEECIALAGDKPIVWEINSSANEALAYSWLGGRRLGRKEGRWRRTKRWAHAARQYPGIWAEEKLRRQLATRASAAICVSSALGLYASESLKIPEVLVLPNGGPLISEADIARRRAKRTNHQFTVFYSGSAMYPWQGLDYLAETIRLAEKEEPDMRFVFAVNQRTELLPDSPNVVIVERLDREGILDAICSADACVALPPEWPWSPYGFHGSPMKLFEYMACMCAVVTSNHGQMAELIKDGKDGLLCENDAKDILIKLKLLKSQPQLAVEIGRAGWERVQSELNWPCNVAKSVELFSRLV